MDDLLTYKVKFDGARLRVKPQLPEVVNQTLEAQLSYKDTTNQYALNKIKAKNPKFRPPPPKTHYLWDRFSQSCPTGLIGTVLQVLKSFKIEYQLLRTVEPPKIAPVEFPEDLYEHQIQMAQLFLEKMRLSVEIPTQQGKTKGSAWAVKQFPEARILLITPGADMLKQAVLDYQEIFPEEPIGILGDGKCQWERITLGIINSVKNLVPKQSPELKETQVIIWDECHKLGGQMFQDVSEYCTNALFRMGMSGTTFRNGNDGILITAASGPKRLTIEMKDIIKERGWDFKYLVTPFEHPTDFVFNGAKKIGETITYPRTWNKKPDDKELYDEFIVRSEDRNQLICRIAWAHYHSNKSGGCLILAERHEHARRLRDCLSELLGFEVPMAIGGQADENMKIKEGIISEEHRVAIATRVFNMGISMPSLEVAILARGLKSPIDLYQGIGRLLGPKPGKSRCWFIDIMDIEPNYLQNHSKERIIAVEKRYPGSVQYLSEEELLEKL